MRKSLFTVSGSLFALLVVLVLLPTPRLSAASLYSQPPDPNNGTILKSAWYPPDGMDGDEYAFDSFVLGSTQTITEIHWRGGYTNYKSGAGKSPVSDFTVTLYGPGLVDSEPALTYLVQYQVGGNAGETPAGTFAGTDMYDYAYVLPTPFQAQGGTKYWLQIEASQGVTPFYGWPPDWGFQVGTGGNGTHFQIIIGGTLGGGNQRVILGSDTAFTLLGADTPTNTPTKTATLTPTSTRTRTATATATQKATKVPTNTPIVTNTPCTPKKPSLLSPYDKAAPLNTRHVALDWSNARCATRYEVEIRLGSSSGALVDQKMNLGKSQYTTIALKRGKSYVWHVQACKGSRCSPWTGFWKFKVSPNAH